MDAKCSFAMISEKNELSSKAKLEIHGAPNRLICGLVTKHNRECKKCE
jgi:hypothetical protein